MRAEGYSLDLYCDREAAHPDGYISRGGDSKFPLQYFGPSQREVYRAARKAGWKLRRGSDLCPVCTKRDTGGTP